MFVIDIDECALASVTGLQACGKGAICKNSPGSFSCYCPTGFVLAIDGHNCIGEFIALSKARVCICFCISVSGFIKL